MRNHWQECLKIRNKNGFHRPETPFSLTGMQDWFKNKFLQDGKVKLAEARMSENGEKIVSTSQKIRSTSRNKVIFSEIRFSGFH